MKKTNQEQVTVLRIAQYKSLFLRRTDFIARNGKQVYVPEDFHEKLSRIVFILGEGKVSIADYMHNVLQCHFQDFGEEIKMLFGYHNKPIL